MRDLCDAFADSVCIEALRERDALHRDQATSNLQPQQKPAIKSCSLSGGRGFQTTQLRNLVWLGRSPCLFAT